MMRDDTAKHIMEFGSEVYRRLIDAGAEIKRLQMEAADEIERMRAELDGCKVTEKDLGGIIRAQEDEIERLRAALEEAQLAAIVGDAPHVIVITRRALKD